MRIAFIHDWEPDHFQELTWQDGLARAVQILGERHQVRFFTMGKEETVLPHPFFNIHVMPSSERLKEAVGAWFPDVILHWADCTRPNAKTLFELGKPQALCYAGGNTQAGNDVYFDHIFVESQVYLEAFERMGCSVSTAFGTNTQLFTPIEDMPKHFDTFFPATYCEWKRHKLFSDATRGLRAATAGFMYDVQETHCYTYPKKQGVLTLPHIDANTLRWMYAASKSVVITSRADGGSQRTVLEAMAMNIPVIVTGDSDKTSEYLIDAGLGQNVVESTPEAIRERVDRVLEVGCKDTRDYIMENWSEYVYADNLEKGLLAICPETQNAESTTSTT
jgi:glycosyltransferase involved in cell wall biosynthesis